MTDTKFGLMLAIFGDTASRKTFDRIGTVAETAGFDTVYAGDHVTFPEEMPDTYPFSRDGSPPPFFGPKQDIYDVFEVLSYLVAATDDLAVGTNACIVPYRRPAVLARNVLTLHALADGDFEFGVAPGWLRTEFEVLDVSFEDRGALTDEFLDLFTRAIETPELSFEGPFHSFQRTSFYPQPEDGGPRIWVGGKSGATIRRTAEYADGWSAYWDRPDDVATFRERLLTAWEDYDRAGTPDISVTRPVHVGTDTDLDTSRPLVGEPETIQADLEAYQEAGLTQFIVDFYAASVDAQAEQLRRFGDDVLPYV